MISSKCLIYSCWSQISENDRFDWVLCVNRNTYFCNDCEPYIALVSFENLKEQSCKKIQSTSRAQINAFPNDPLYSFCWSTLPNLTRVQLFLFHCFAFFNMPIQVFTQQYCSFVLVIFILHYTAILAKCPCQIFYYIGKCLTGIISINRWLLCFWLLATLLIVLL